MPSASDAMDADTETTCSICHAEFLEAEDLAQHIQQVHSPAGTLHPCQFCPSTFCSLEAYCSHIVDTHIVSMRCCKYCTRVFTNVVSLRIHMRKHNYKQAGTYSCSQCRRTFNNVFELEQHEWKCHSNVMEGILLHKCYSVLSSLLNIKAPAFLQSLGTGSIFNCSQCNVSTSDVAEYIAHLTNTKCRSIVCDKCCHVYTHKKALRKHLEKHTECDNYVKDTDKTKLCQSCHKLVDALYFDNHLQYCKPVKCNLCDLIFESLYKLSDHQSKEHPLAISVLKCEYCMKEFVGTVSLQKHIKRVHKPFFHLYKYTCVYCESNYFKHPKQLFAHFFTKHPDLQPYSCNICDKTFRVRKRFTLHIKLDHKSVGFVEFDERYHVFFTDKKSENPFQPTSLISDMNDEENESESEIDQMKLEPQTEKDTEGPTDAETDAEATAKQEVSESERKPPKMRYKELAKSNVNLGNLNSDFMTATETEAIQTDNETKPKVKRKRKCKMPDLPIKTKKSKRRNTDVIETSDQTDDDEPLVNIKKRTKNKALSRKCLVRSWNNKRRQQNRTHKGSKKRLTCKTCNKYCYTFQNYNYHMSLHSKGMVKKCVKCSMEFRTKTALRKHVETEHSSSRLTETLKSMLERRKKGGNDSLYQPTMSEKFQRTIKRVRSIPTKAAIVKEINKELSVQTFIESFTPEAVEAKKLILEVQNNVSLKTVKNPIKKPPAIKMSKFIPKPDSTNFKLAMPVRFKRSVIERHKVSIRFITPKVTQYTAPTYDDGYADESFADYEETVESTKDETIPEVAQEVMLEHTEERKPTVIPHKLVIPKFPKGFKKDIRIAHLLPEAPYFKIIKVKDLVKQTKQPDEETQEEPVRLTLPSGAKLVNVNPLAHLLGNKSIAKVLQTSKYYKPKKMNVQATIVRALSTLDKPPPIRKKKKKEVEVEQ